MYRWLRNTHLWLGMLAVLFLAMYGISSVQMAHNSWFTTRPTVTETTLALEPGGANARAIARALMDRHGMRGEVQAVRAGGEKLAFRIARPGTVYEVEYTAASGEARIRTSRAGFIAMLNRIHHVGGLWHDYGLLNVWGVFVGLVSAGLIVLGATGIYLWFKIHSERSIGAVLLASSLVYGITVMILLRTA
jgi:hypothetical protein